MPWSRRITSQELDQLNRLVSMFLDFAEDRALRRIEMRMADWIEQTDRFLSFNERAVLTGAGPVSHGDMETAIGERYAAFDARRRATEALAAHHEAEDELSHLQAEAQRLAAAKKLGPS